MTTSYLLVTAIATVLNGLSGVAAILRFRPILPGMAAVGVPVSWLVFPIGTLKLAGALGLLAGLALPVLGTAAAIGLVLYFVCAVYTHVRAADYSAQFGLAVLFLAVDSAALALSLYR